MPIRNIDKKKSNNEETKTEWQTTFCGLVHPPSLQKKKRKKTSKVTKTKWQTSCCAVPSLDRCKKRKTNKTNKKGNKEYTGKLLAVALSSLHLCKEENKQKKKTKKNIEGNKEQNGKLLAVTLSGLHLCMTTTCSGQWPRVNANNADGETEKKLYEYVHREGRDYKSEDL